MTKDLDLSKYPDGTDKVIVAIDRQTVQSYEVGFATFKSIADETGLTKEQVRYRVNKLDENGHIRRERPYPEKDNRGVVQIWLTPDAENYARDLLEYEEIVGRFPEDPTQDDFIELLDYVRELESRIEELESDVEKVKDWRRT